MASNLNKNGQDIERLKAYWRKNITYVGILLLIWFLSSYGAGILFAGSLNEIRIGGFKLGFWFAQQGSMYIFIGIIFVYVWLMSKLDKEYDVDEK
jgi:putative solute:sodium symporter small subunit